MYNQEILIKIEKNKKFKQNLLLKISNFFNLIHVNSKFIFKYISLFSQMYDAVFKEAIFLC